MQMDIGKAFTFVGEDPKWVNKVLIGGALILAGFLAIFTVVGWIFVFAIVLGYLVQLTRNVIAQQQHPLPEWTDFGAMMGDGFRAIVVYLVVSLPVILASIIVLLPGIIVSAIDQSNGGSGGAGGALTALGYCLIFPLSILVYLMLPVAVARYAVTRSIGAALQFGQLFAALRANFVTYLLVMLLSYAAQFVGQFGILLCGIGLPFTMFYAFLVQYHLYGQAHLKTQGSVPGYGQPQQAYPPAFPY